LVIIIKPPSLTLIYPCKANLLVT